MTPEQFIMILAQGETQHVEFKGAEAFQGNFRAHLAASITAMANTADGGTILIGIENGTRRIIGLTREQLATFDETEIGNYLRTRVQPLPTFHLEQIVDLAGIVLAIQIMEFSNTPHVVNRDIAGDRGRFASQGDILVRTATRECRRIQTAEEMDDLLQRAVRRKGEWLISHMRSIILGTPQRPAEIAPDRRFVDMLPNWHLLCQGLEQQYPHAAYWEVRLLPLPEQRVELLRAAQVVQNSAVEWRGWEFPQQSDRPTYYDRYISAELHWISDIPDYPAGHYDFWQMSDQGALGAVSTIWSELAAQAPRFNYPVPPERLLPWTDIIWSISEQMRFAATFAESFDCDHLWVYIALRNVQDRRLGAYGQELLMPIREYRSYMPMIVHDHTFAKTDLIGGWQEFAIEWAKQIYTAFQWPDISPDRLATLQQRLIERRL